MAPIYNTVKSVISLVRQPKFKRVLQIIILLVTLVFFGKYIHSHQEEFLKIRSLSIFEFILIFVGQIIAVFGNILIIVVFGMFINRKIPLVNAAKIGAYSSVVNFFGFLQGGFGVRGIYLKTQYNMSIKKYLGISMIQYVVLFALAGVFVLTGLMATGFTWPRYLLLVAMAVLLVIVVVLRLLPRAVLYLQKKLKSYTELARLRPIVALMVATLIYLSGGLLAFGVELSVVGATISAGSLLVYTGITQFTILIAITPGGLGIREAILLIAQSQMMLSTSDIIVASTIDRAVYFITLAVLFAFSIGATKYIGQKDSL